MPASRSARATTLAPRSCPARPGLATTTRIRALIVEGSLHFALKVPRAGGSPKPERRSTRPERSAPAGVTRIPTEVDGSRRYRRRTLCSRFRIGYGATVANCGESFLFPYGIHLGGRCV